MEFGVYQTPMRTKFFRPQSATWGNGKSPSQKPESGVTPIGPSDKGRNSRKTGPAYLQVKKGLYLSGCVHCHWHEVCEQRDS